MILNLFREVVKYLSTYVFPGQGSQVKGMGGELFDEFRELTAQADEVLGYSIKRLCMEDTDSNLNQTQFTQPALYTVNALSYLKKTIDTGRKPDFVSGHSLGEYNALFVSGAFDFKDGLKLVKKRGELISRVTGGGMAAVIGLNEEQVREVLQSNGLSSIDIANLNSPYQIVLSGLRADIENAKPIFENTSGVKMVVILKTSGAFHSRYMEEATKEFDIFISDFKFSKLTIPVIANVTARSYRQAEIKQNLIKQITSPVKWTESIRYLMGRGEEQFEEIGVGRVLTGLIQKIKTEAEPLFVEEVEAEEDARLEEKKVLPHDDTCRENSSKTRSPVRNKAKAEDTSDDDSTGILPGSLGDSDFRKDYNLKYAYLSGGMHHGISSKEMVVKMGMAGMMGFFGTWGLEPSRIKEDVKHIQSRLPNGQSYGVNLVHSPANLELEEKIADVCLDLKVSVIEASSFLTTTPALVKYRAKGLKRGADGKVICSNRIIAKLSRPEVAESFMSPAPERIVSKLLAENKISREEANLLKEVPLAEDICAEADSARQNDGGASSSLLPAMIKLRDEMMDKFRYKKKIRVGSAGGIGTPEAAAAAFVLGAEFIMTGSINQCTVEADTSDVVKDLLQQMNVQDTELVPSGDMFEFAAKVQVLKKGVFFHVRANKLYDLYRMYNSLEEIDERTRNQIQEKYFKCSFEKVYEDIKAFNSPHEIEQAERNPKQKMALIFKWYFTHSNQLALRGIEELKVDFQIYSSPAMGAFNQWVKGTTLENWKNRHVEMVAEKIMDNTAKVLSQRFRAIVQAN